MRHRSPITMPGHRKGIPNPNKGKKFPVEICTPQEVLAMIETCNAGVSGIRNAAIIATLWRTGMRVGELCGLRAYDFDFDRRSVRVRGTKTAAADRIVAIDEGALRYVRDWFDLRERELHQPGHTAAFCCISRHERGRPVKPTYVRQMVKERAAKAGIVHRVHPHALRHTLASDLMDEGIDIRYISGQLGHANSAITARYTDHVNPKRRLDVLGSRVWPT
jgi:site-specific recombinase XerD